MRPAGPSTSQARRFRGMIPIVAALLTPLKMQGRVADGADVVLQSNRSAHEAERFFFVQEDAST